MKGYFMDQLGIRSGQNVEQNGGKRVYVQKQKACSRTPVVKTEPHRNESKLLFLGITVLLLDTSVQVRCYVFHPWNDTKPLKAADKKVTTELKATHTCNGSTIMKAFCHAEGSGLPVWVCCWEDHPCPAFRSWQHIWVMLHNPLHAAACSEFRHSSWCGTLLWCTADISRISEILHIWVTCTLVDLLAGWKTHSLWPCKLGIRDGVFSLTSTLLVIILWSELTFQNILGNFYELVKSPDLPSKIKKLPISPQESGANIQPEVSLLTAFVVFLLLRYSYWIKP